MKMGRCSCRSRISTSTIDIKNAIEKDGGFVEVTLNRELLVVPLCSFLDFMKIFAEGEDRENLCKTIRKKYREHQKDQAFVEKEPTGQMLKKCGESIVVGLIGDVLASISPISAGLKAVVNIGKNIYKAIR